MDENGSETSQSSSSEDSERPSKRQKLDTQNSSSPNSPQNDSTLPIAQDSERMQQEFKALHRKLYRTEAAAGQYLIIRAKTEEMFEKEKTVLQTHAQLNKEKISLFRGDLTRSMRLGEEARRAQTTAEDKLSQMKIVLGQQVAPLIRGLITRDAPLVQEISKDVQETPKPAEETGKPLENDSMSQEESYSEDIQLKEVKRDTTVLKARAERVEKIEEELRVAGNTISSLNEALKKKELCMKEKFDEAERLQQQLMILRNNLSAGDVQESLEPLGNTSSSGGEASAEGSRSLEEEPDDNDEESEDGEDEKDNSGMLMGYKYSVLAWRPQFSEIDWKKELIRNGKVEWACSTCSYTGTKKERCEDHVWIAHYKGKFGCAYCTEDPSSFSWRQTLRDHIRKKHQL